MTHALVVLVQDAFLISLVRPLRPSPTQLHTQLHHPAS